MNVSSYSVSVAAVEESLWKGNCATWAGEGGCVISTKWATKFAGMRTFLVALDRSAVDCREAKGANWAGRSPLLGSIAMCLPTSSTIRVGFRKVVCTGLIHSAFRANLRDPRITRTNWPQLKLHQIPDLVDYCSMHSLSKIVLKL
jgi:hypothetical protein